MEYIHRHEVLNQMDEGAAFDMVFITCDRKRGTGGELVTVKGWQKATGEREYAVTEGGRLRFVKRALVRNPNHARHKTVNIINPLNPRMHPVKVHVRLIQFFNGKRAI